MPQSKLQEDDLMFSGIRGVIVNMIANRSVIYEVIDSRNRLSTANLPPQAQAQALKDTYRCC